MEAATINKLVTIRYVALGFTTGLTDLVLTVRKPNGDILTPAPVFTEVGESGNYDGVYEVSYTPDALGVWQEKITSVSNGDKIVRSHEVVAYDVQDVKAQTQSIEDKVDIIDTVVDATKIVVDDTKVVVDSIEDKVDVIDGVVDATKIVVDETKVVVDATKVVVDSTEDKVDAVKADTEAIIDAIDNLPFNRGGGYFA